MERDRQHEFSIFIMMSTTKDNTVKISDTIGITPLSIVANDPYDATNVGSSVCPSPVGPNFI